MTRSSQRFAPWLLALLVVAVDQATKRFVVHTMNLNESIPFLGDAVRWTYIHNYDMAFGIKAMGGRLLGVVSTVATLLFAFILLKSRRETLFIRLALGAVIGGAIGNTIDRLTYGYVIDFIDVNLPDWLMRRWPVFNLADSAVSVIHRRSRSGSTDRLKEQSRA